MRDEETRIVERLRQKDAAALGEFLTACRARLLAHIERRLGAALRRKVEPHDILQEVSLHALQGLARADLREPFGWLCQIAEQRIVDAHRKYVAAQKRSADREVSLHAPAGEAEVIDMLVASITSPSAAVSRDSREARLHAALATLPAETREALRLRYAEGLPTKAIAERLGKRDGAVRVLLARAVARLQELLIEPTTGG
jgi:RNA polymerase sigma-70 factor (ECF subfamily)